MKKTLTLRRAAIVVGLLVVLMVGVAGLFTYQSNLETKRIEAQKEKELDIIRAKEANVRAEEARKILAEKIKQNKIDNCLSSAWNTYDADWKNACEAMGRKEDCSLPMYKGDIVDGRYKDMQDACYKRY